MTPQEQQLLESLANRIANTQLPQKDPQAENLIRDRIGSRPDALYILTQTVLIQEMALNQANQRLHDLQMQQSTQSGYAPQQPTSFLGRLFGMGEPQRAQAPPAPPAAYAPEPLQYAGAPSGGSSFLRSAAATATGVAAGALAFEGIESLFGHHQGFGGGGYGAIGGGEFLQGAPSETVINNYYDAPGEDSGRDNLSAADYQDSSADDFQDVSDAGDDTSSNDSSSDSYTDV